MYISFAGERPQAIEPVSDKMCVLYDPRDGRAVHFHRVITLRGGRENSTSEIERLALETARRNLDVTGLRALHGDTRELNYQVGQSYRVNLERMTLEEVRHSGAEALQARPSVRPGSR